MIYVSFKEYVSTSIIAQIHYPAGISNKASACKGTPVIFKDNLLLLKVKEISYMNGVHAGDYLIDGPMIF